MNWNAYGAAVVVAWVLVVALLYHLTSNVVFAYAYGTGAAMLSFMLSWYVLIGYDRLRG